jgi:hypothetical protein
VTPTPTVTPAKHDTRRLNSLTATHVDADRERTPSADSATPTRTATADPWRTETPEGDAGRRP